MESSFLGVVAADLLARYGEKISEFHFIFPNSAPANRLQQHLKNYSP